MDEEQYLSERCQEMIDLMVDFGDVPVGLIMRLNQDELEVFVASDSDNNPYQVGESAIMEDSGLYCETVIHQNGMLKVPNALTDDHWKDNPDVELNLISYLGYPIHWPDRSIFGTICALDNKENHYSSKFEKLLCKFRDFVEMELTLIKNNQILEDTVIERTRDIKIAMIEASLAKEVAEKANMAKTKFLSSMSHELRTPLTSILGFSQLLEIDSQNFDKSQQENLMMIQRSGQNLLNLIEQLFEFSKTESVHLPLFIETISPHKIIDEYILLLQYQAEKKGISLNLKNCPDIIIRADRFLLKQIIFHLLSNAIKYNKQDGEVTISYSVVKNEKFKLIVTDTGLGIPKEKQKQLFVAFSRLGREMSTIEGAGVGLTISKRAVELMNGQIGFESVEGKGSTFWVEFSLSNT